MKKTFTLTHEIELIEALKSHSRKAFNELYDRYTPTLLGIITRMVIDQQVAEDILQETYVKVWKSIHLHDPSKGRLFTWLVNVARNTALDHLRSHKKMVPLAQDGSMGGFTFTNITQIGFRSTVSTHLETKQWQVIELLYFQGYTHQEVSDLLTLPLGTVKTRARLALAALRSHFAIDTNWLYSPAV